MLAKISHRSRDQMCFGDIFPQQTLQKQYSSCCRQVKTYRNHIQCNSLLFFIRLVPVSVRLFVAFGKAYTLHLIGISFGISRLLLAHYSFSVNWMKGASVTSDWMKNTTEERKKNWQTTYSHADTYYTWSMEKRTQDELKKDLNHIINIFYMNKREKNPISYNQFDASNFSSFSLVVNLVAKDFQSSYKTCLSHINGRSSSPHNIVSDWIHPILYLRVNFSLAFVIIKIKLCLRWCIVLSFLVASLIFTVTTP